MKSFIALLVFIFSFGWLGVLFDTVDMGNDYFELTPNPTSVSAAAVAQAYTENADNRGNVFVIADDEDFAKVREALDAGDPTVTDRHGAVVRTGDAILSTPVVAYSDTSSDDEFLEVSRTVVRRILTLGYLWRVTGQAVYADRAVSEIENVCAFPDWRTSQFLNVAEMSFAVALGCNWLYDYITPELRATAAAACYDKAIVPGQDSLIDNWWRWSKTNWNGVCYGAMGATAMVFYEEYGATARTYLADAYNKMPYGFTNFTPDGVYVEGSGYWDYSADYISWFIASSDNFLGDDFGLADIDGLLEMGTFPLYITGAQGPFNYGDNKNERVGSASIYWFANEYMAVDASMAWLLDRYEDASVADMIRYPLTEEQAGQVSLANLLDRGDYGDEAGELPLAVHLRSDENQELAVFRSAYLDPNATYAAIKAGYNYTNHGDLDIGTFVYDYAGVRWAEDLGPTYYSTDDYFLGIVGGGRWKTYAKRAEGQNTLVFNPSSVLEDQYPYARGEVTEFEEYDGDGGRAVVNMSSAYKYCGVRYSFRDFALTDNYSTLTVTDTFSCTMLSDVYWFMHTKAEIEIVDAHTAILTIGNVSLKATLSEDSVGEFGVMELVSLVDGVDNTVRFGEGVRKLVVTAKDVKEGKISVTLTPVN